MEVFSGEVDGRIRILEFWLERQGTSQKIGSAGPPAALTR